jgi:hypothetical protein
VFHTVIGDRCSGGNFHSFLRDTEGRVVVLLVEKSLASRHILHVILVVDEQVLLRVTPPQKKKKEKRKKKKEKRKNKKEKIKNKKEKRRD